MNESIVVAKMRKETKLTIPAGGWVILSNPDKSFTDADAAFNAVPTGVSEEYAQVIVGKIAHTRTAKNLLSKQQFDDQFKVIKDRDEKILKIAADARERQVTTQTVRLEKQAQDHKAQLAAKNKMVSDFQKTQEQAVKDRQSMLPKAA